MHLPLLRAVLNLPYDVVLDRILPRVLTADEGKFEISQESSTSTTTPRAVLEEVICALNDVYNGDEVRVRDMYASLLQHFCRHVFDDLGVVPRPASSRHLFLSDCHQLCSSSHPERYPTLRWSIEADQCYGARALMATTLLASPTGTRVVLWVRELQVRGNTLQVYLQCRNIAKRPRELTGGEHASVASLAVVARRRTIPSRAPASYGELVLGEKAYCYQEARDALEANRFTMSEIKSLSSTTSVTYKAGGRVVIEFPNVMSSLNLGARSTGEELMLTVGACFVGLDLVHHMAYYPVRLSVVEDLILASRRNGGHAGVFSSLNRLDCGMRVLSSWEKRMF